MFLKRTKRYLLSCCFILCCGVFAFGQPQQNKHSSSFQKIHSIKLQVVTKDMKLTEVQEKQFLPLYKEYTDKLHHVYKEKRALKNNTNSSFVIDERLRLEQQIIAIKSDYKSKFLNIISADQLEQMYKGEERFRQMLVERLKHK